MPVSYLDIQGQVHQMGEYVHQRERSLQELRDLAIHLLNVNASKTEYLRRRVEMVVGGGKRLRCAVPVTEALNGSFTTSKIHSPVVLLAADGSQINPDHHAAYEYALINVGVLRIDPSGGQKPREITSTRLLYGEEIDRPQGFLNEDMVALLRDLAERRLLANLAAQENMTVIALTDGTLELFREDSNSQEYRQYIAELAHLAEGLVITAGYVDKPRADLLVRLLELVVLSDEDLHNAGSIRPLHGVRDRDLMEHFLKPGERSAVFYQQSGASSQFTGSIALHFFYLNVGQPGHPWLARVEIPAWVAENPQILALLHAVLLEQCQQMGSKPYPYALHRAHEIAVVSQDEKRHVENLIAVELLGRRMSVGEQSNKQYAKDISGTRTRYIK